MDEYQLEIQSIRRTLARLRADRAAGPLIEEYEAELRNLVALYQAATTTYAEGEADSRLRAALAHLGFGEWTMENVYGFVYDASLEAEPDGRDLANAISHTDYAAGLRLVLDDMS